MGGSRRLTSSGRHPTLVWMVGSCQRGTESMGNVEIERVIQKCLLFGGFFILLLMLYVTGLVGNHLSKYKVSIQSFLAQYNIQIEKLECFILDIKLK